MSYTAVETIIALQAGLERMDELEKTNLFKKKVKYHGKGLITELEKHLEPHVDNLDIDKETGEDRSRIVSELKEMHLACISKFARKLAKMSYVEQQQYLAND